MVRLPLPMNLAAASAQGPDTWRAWLDGLPATVAALAGRWGLELGPPYEPGGHTAWVAPARHAAGRELVLKVGWRHDDAEHEADGLAAWAGYGAVRLHESSRAGPTAALLLERCTPGTTLAASSLTGPEQDEVVAGLLRRLWTADPGSFAVRPLQVMCDAWADETESGRAGHARLLDPGLLRAGVALFRELPATAPARVLLVTDLHALNVLAAEREPWLVIDPKPYAGDPAYDGVQHILNCPRRLRADPAGFCGRLAGLLGVDAGRLRAWVFARCVLDAPYRPELVGVAADLAP